jgi:hypothetical protein
MARTLRQSKPKRRSLDPADWPAPDTDEVDRLMRAVLDTLSLWHDGQATTKQLRAIYADYAAHLWALALDDNAREERGLEPRKETAEYRRQLMEDRSSMDPAPRNARALAAYIREMEAPDPIPLVAGRRDARPLVEGDIIETSGEAC